MGKHGAKHIILSSRSGKKQANTMEIVEELGALGVKVEVHQSDVAIAEDLRRLISDCARSMPRIGGVIHGADRTLLSSWRHIRTGSMSCSPNSKGLGICTTLF